MKAAKETKAGKSRLVKGILFLVIFAAVVAVVMIVVKPSPTIGKKTSEKNVVTTSTLEKIVKASELSTFTTIYNGIAQVMNEKKPEQTDYYVSYHAQVYAGIDFEEIEISINDDTKTISMKLPDVQITDIDVDISSLEFIFYNEKANRSTVTQEAYEACLADVKAESSAETAILDLAQESAENTLHALIQPLIDQMDEPYTLLVE